VAEAGWDPQFLLPNMKPEHRRGERWLWKQVAQDMGFSPVDVDGTWEGQGDVASFRERVLVFYGGRTTEAGAKSAATHLPRAMGGPLFIQIREPAFHGNMALLPLAHADRLLVCPDVLVGDSLATLEKAFGRERLVPVTLDEGKAYATNGLPIGRDVLAPHLTPARVRDLLGSMGLTVVVLSMTELCEKAGGASRCLVSVASVDQDRVRIPLSLDYRRRRPELLGRVGVGT
jgi:N-dimethylarginine dimethylaminohydrolase